MKRAADPDRPIEAEEADPKRRRSDGGGEEEEEAAVAELGEDVVREVLRRADARTLGGAACVSRAWRRMAEDEGVWEAVCTRQWAELGCPVPPQLRSVVLALGGFRRLHARYLRRLLQPRPSLWGKDQLQLSLSLLSIGYFEKMNFPPPPKPSSTGR